MNDTPVLYRTDSIEKYWTTLFFSYQGKKYACEIKHFPEPSIFGIGGWGKISKLFLTCLPDDSSPFDFSKCLIVYDRGWSNRPKTKAAKEIFNIVCEKYN